MDLNAELSFFFSARNAMPTRKGPEEEVGAVASVPARVSTLRRLDTCTGGEDCLYMLYRHIVSH